MNREQTGWEAVYQKYGIVQKEPITSVLKLAEIIGTDYSKSFEALDAGCGTGRHIIFLASQYPRATIIGVDSSPTAVEIAQNSLSKLNSPPRARAIVADIDQGLPNLNEFDFVLSTLVIHHGFSSDIQRRFNKLDQHLRDNGLFVFAAPSTDDPRFFTGTEAEPGTKINSAQSDGYLPHHFFTQTEVLRLFANYEPLWLEHTHREMVTAKGIAANWEGIFKKKK